MSREPAGEGQPWGRAVVVALGIGVAVYVLFTWVFPWITEMGLSPTMD